MYLEICRIINSYLGYGVSLGEGYITKEQILRNFENVVYPSKLNSILLKKYFSIYDQNTDSAKPLAEKQSIYEILLDEN
jgi:hypothetical protein